MPPKHLPADLFPRLREVLRAVSRDCTVQLNTERVYTLTMKGILYKKKPIFFASVSQKESYIGFNLMPLAICPVLAKRVTPELRKSLHGYNCFHFTAVSETLLKQLKTLVAASAVAYPAALKAAGYEISRD
jgi:hypothetical protein